jgi:hypothetical protein
VGFIALEFADRRPMLDVLESAKGIATGLLDQRFDSGQEYADRFCSRLAADIQAGSTGIAMPHSFGLRGMFSGYSSGQAVFIQMQFPSVNGYLLRPTVQEVFHNPVDRFCIVSGFEVVLNEMNEQVYGPETLKEAIEYVQDYITRCIKNDTDPYCANIGGNSQIATVTPDKGFNWVFRP